MGSERILRQLGGGALTSLHLTAFILPGTHSPSPFQTNLPIETEVLSWLTTGQFPTFWDTAKF